MPEYYSRSMVLMACGIFCGAVGCAAAVVLGRRLYCKIRWQRPAVRPIIAAMVAPSCTLGRSLAPATWTSLTVEVHIEDRIFESIFLASIDTFLALFSLNVAHNACFGLRRISVILSMFAMGSVAVSRSSALVSHSSCPYATPSVLRILLKIALGLLGTLFLRWSYAARLDSKSGNQVVSYRVWFMQGPCAPICPWQRHPRRVSQGDRHLAARVGINLEIHRAALRGVSSRQFVKVAPLVAALHCSTRLRPESFSRLADVISFVDTDLIFTSTLDSSVHLVALDVISALRWAVSNVLFVTRKCKLQFLRMVGIDTDSPPMLFFILSNPVSFVLVSNLRWPNFNLVPLQRLGRSIRRISTPGHQNSTEPRTAVNQAGSDVLPPPPSVERVDLPDTRGGENGAPLVGEPSNRSRPPTVEAQPHPHDPTSPVQSVVPSTSQGEPQQPSVAQPVESECKLPSSSNGPYWHNLERISKKQTHPSASGWRRRRVRMRTSLGTILTAFSPKSRDTHASPITGTGSASSSQVDQVEVPTTAVVWDPVDEHGASSEPSRTTVPNGGAEMTPQTVDQVGIDASTSVAEPEVRPSMPTSTTDVIEPSSKPREARKSVFLEQLGTFPQTPIPDGRSAESPGPSELDSDPKDRPNSRWLLPPLTSRSLTAPTTPTSPPTPERLTRAASMEAMHQITCSLLSTPRSPRPENVTHRFSSIASRMGVPSQDSPPCSTPHRVISASKRLHRQVKDIVVPNSRDSAHSSSELSFHCAGESEALEIVVTTNRTQVSEENEQLRSPAPELTAEGAQVADSLQSPPEKTRRSVVARTRTLIRKKTQWWSSSTSSKRILSRNLFHKTIMSPLARRKKHPPPVNPGQLDIFSPRPPSLQSPTETTSVPLGSPISESFWQPDQLSRSEPPSLRLPPRPKTSRARTTEERPSLFLLSLEDHQASSDTPELVDLWKDVMAWKRNYHGDSSEDLRSDGSSFPSFCEQYPDFPQVPSRPLRSTSAIA
ncbi:BQ2448_3585 [Microbotryum intermedium]|uniref:BQ2448_3585 protein n=1 Tax=Microbotryum intermedium TaxID=269621 RepID=A0A238FFN5_9BASI|nr:BQ2448_3585 [Microbotryum intermedium]